MKIFISEINSVLGNAVGRAFKDAIHEQESKEDNLNQEEVEGQTRSLTAIQTEVVGTIKAKVPMNPLVSNIHILVEEPLDWVSSIVDVYL